MKKFIIKIIGLTIVLVLSALGLDIAVSKGLRKNETKLFSTMTKAYQGKINADLIVNGSSKAFVQVSPQILDSIIGIDSYNLGLDGSPFIPQKALFELYKLNNKKPKVIVQVVSNGTLRSLDDGFLNPIKFAPYLNIPVIKKHMILTSSFDYLDYNIPLFRFSGKPFETITGILSLFNVNLFKEIGNKGYYPNDKYWSENVNKKTNISDNQVVDTENISEIKEFTSLDSTSCELFEDFLSQCKLNNILVILVYPPIYSEASNTIKNIDYYNEVAQEYNAYFLNYARDSSLVFNREYFYNSQHLNTNGARLFTTKLAEDVKARTHNILYK